MIENGVARLRFPVIPTGFRWFAMISGLLGRAFHSAKRITFAHGPAKNRIGPGFGPTRSDPSPSDPLWVDFWSVLGPFSVRFWTAWAVKVPMQVHMTMPMHVQMQIAMGMQM